MGDCAVRVWVLGMMEFCACCVPIVQRPRTSPFHGGNGGSNPPEDANTINQLREILPQVPKAGTLWGLMGRYSWSPPEPLLRRHYPAFGQHRQYSVGTGARISASFG